MKVAVLGPYFLQKLEKIWSQNSELHIILKLRNLEIGEHSSFLIIGKMIL